MRLVNSETLVFRPLAKKITEEQWARVVKSCANFEKAREALNIYRELASYPFLNLDFDRDTASFVGTVNSLYGRCEISIYVSEEEMLDVSVLFHPDHQAVANERLRLLDDDFDCPEADLLYEDQAEAVFQLFKGTSFELNGDIFCGDIHGPIYARKIDSLESALADIRAVASRIG